MKPNTTITKIKLIYNVTTEDVVSKETGTKEVSEARHLLMLYFHKELRFSLSDTALFFNRKPASAQYAVKKVGEIARFDRSFRLLLSDLGLLKLLY